MKSSCNTIDAHTPGGIAVQVALEPSPVGRYRLDQLDQACGYLKDQGYVVLEAIYGKGDCDATNAAWDAEVKPYRGHLYRQTTANPERNLLNAHGMIMNPLLNLQSLPEPQCAEIKSNALRMYSDPNLVSVLSAVFSGVQPKLVQSMYFEGNSATWEHQDTYYLDSEILGSMVGCWIALEDIDARAGRFFVVPGSHQIDMQKNSGQFDVAFHHERYKELIRQIIRQENLECRAPALKQGDVLIWNSRTIHGSLKTIDESLSRRSLTAHFIPENHRFMQFQSRIKPLQLKRVNRLQVHCPKDQELWRNRAVLWIETRFPRSFQAIKKLAVKMVTG